MEELLERKGKQKKLADQVRLRNREVTTAAKKIREKKEKRRSKAKSEERIQPKRARSSQRSSVPNLLQKLKKRRHSRKDKQRKSLCKSGELELPHPNRDRSRGTIEIHEAVSSEGEERSKPRAADYATFGQGAAQRQGVSPQHIDVVIGDKRFSPERTGEELLHERAASPNNDLGSTPILLEPRFIHQTQRPPEIFPSSSKKESQKIQEAVLREVCRREIIKEKKKAKKTRSKEMNKEVNKDKCQKNLLALKGFLKKKNKEYKKQKKLKDVSHDAIRSERISLKKKKVKKTKNIKDDQTRM